MAEKFISPWNLRFLLTKHLDAAALMKYPYFADHSRETFDMVLETAMRMGKGILYPALSEMDKKPPQFKDGKVFVHPLRTSHSTGGRSTPAATSSPKSFRRSTALPPV